MSVIVITALNVLAVIKADNFSCGCKIYEEILKNMYLYQMH